MKTRAPLRSRLGGRQAARILRRVYELAFQRQGHRGWWPAQSDFEMCVGAILTQNTNWQNVRRAIDNLKAAGVLSPRALHELPEPRLAELIQPAGYFNVKARRLRAFVRVLVEEHGGRLSRLFAGETAAVRARLLGIHGVGPETADSMLLYAGDHLSFVVDAYTRRIFLRHRWCRPAHGYEDLRALLASALEAFPDRPTQLDYWQDYHAQLVAIGNTWCRPRAPHCAECPLAPLLDKKCLLKTEN